MTKQIYALSAALAVFACTQSQAAITAVSDNFDVNSNTFSNWTSVGVFGTLRNYDAVSGNDFDKLDLINSQINALDGDGIIGNLAGDTEPTGDGLLNDGGLWFNSQDAIAGNEAIGLTLVGNMSLGEQYTLTMGFYNDNTSFWSGRIQLFDLTANTVLAETANTTVLGSTSVTYKPLDWMVSYTAQAADVGNLLQIRVVENANSTARDAYVDNFSLATVVPEPSMFATIVVGAGLFLFTGRRRDCSSGN